MSTSWIVIDDSSGPMAFEDFQGHKLFRPRAVTEVAVRRDLETHLRQECSVGTYTAPEAINTMLQRQFAYLQSELVAAVTPLAGRDAMQFILNQYDESCAVDGLCKKNQLSEERTIRWNALGPTFRRAIKYLAEMMVLYHSGSEPAPLGEDTAIELMDKAFCFAEQMVELYILSDQTYALFPDRTTVEIRPEGELDYLTLTVADSPEKDMRKRIEIDRMNRSRFMPHDECPLFRIDAQAAHLDAAFKQDHGITYNDSLAALCVLNDNAQPADGGFQMPFCEKASVVNGLSEDMRIPPDAVERALDGFSVRQHNLRDEGRALFKPKQEYRAYRRGFFEFPWETRTHYSWSKGMARESYIHLVTGMPFKQLPEEWCTPGTEAAVEKLSNEVGKWFEGEVLQQLAQIGFAGRIGFKKGVGVGPARIPIPSDVGEIDYLGYSESERLLLVGEFKMVRHGFEPTFFRDDVSDFVTSKKAYATKFRKKVEWVASNLNDVVAALASEPDLPNRIDPKGMAKVLVTGFPSFASYFIDDFPCVSAVELRVAHEKQSAWPYKLHSQLPS